MKHSNFFRNSVVVLVLIVAWSALITNAAEPIRVLVIDGRNNHDWQKTTESLVATLKATGRFSVDISTAPPGFPKPMPVKPKAGDTAAQPAYDAALKEWKDENTAYTKAHQSDWDSWLPHFMDYAAVVNNYNGPDWPKPMKEAFVEFVRKGGGVVNIHAANNDFANWAEFNDMIGIGWRPATFGQRIAIDDSTGKPIAIPQDAEKITIGGFASGHGSKHPFVIKTRDADHPIVQGLPAQWLHGRDELYHRMRGSLENLHVIASTYSEPKENGTGMHEPMIWWTSFGQGRVVTTSMGHLWPGDTQFDALHCVGFQTIFARSVEWSATGKVDVARSSGFSLSRKGEHCAAGKSGLEKVRRGSGDSELAFR